MTEDKPLGPIAGLRTIINALPDEEMVERLNLALKHSLYLEQELVHQKTALEAQQRKIEGRNAALESIITRATCDQWAHIACTEIEKIARKALDDGGTQP